tara:strand:- start:1466 stop:2296 length:831 start_codon:yes stop_codon:yes gene_type:complete
VVYPQLEVVFDEVRSPYQELFDAGTAERPAGIPAITASASPPPTETPVARPAPTPTRAQEDTGILTGAPLLSAANPPPPPGPVSFASTPSREAKEPYKPSDSKMAEITESIAYTGNNPFNLTIGGGNWQGATTQEGGREAVGHKFETFSDPTYGFRAGFLNLVVKNDRNIAAGRDNSIKTILQEVTPYEQNKPFWDGKGEEKIALEMSRRLGRRIEAGDPIDLNDEEVGRAFGKAVANMEIGSGGDPWGGVYDKGLDMAYERIRQRRSQRQEQFAE